MSIVSQIFLYKDEPGEGSARITKILCASGCEVDTGQHLFDVETAKACQEIYSPANGLLVHDLREGQDVKFGAVIAEITAETLRAASVVPERGRPSQTGANLNGLSDEASFGRPVVSHEAGRLLERLGVDPNSLGCNLITTAVVHEKLGGPPEEDKIAAPVPARPEADLSRLSWHKVQERSALRGCAGGSYLSMVGIEIVSPGFKREGAGFFENKILDLVVFESANLMPAFPNLNAAYRHPDQIEQYNDIRPGVAFHGGSNLLTYVIKGAALVDAASVRQDILSGFKKYVQNKLRREDTAGATYTVSDLSASGADFVLPLVPTSQSCIIGITRGREGFHLYLAFDHRVTDGYEAARFLKTLSGRISTNAEEPGRFCVFCGARPKPATPSTMLLALHDAAGNTFLSCRACWN